MSVKLTYIGHMLLDDPTSPRLWDVLEPKLEGYDVKQGYPTLGLEGLKEHGLIPNKEETL